MEINMNGQRFYDAFKEALDFFNIDWHNKEDMKVKVENNHIIFYCETSSLEVRVNLIKEE